MSRVLINVDFPAAASNPESEVCPVEGLYGLRGAIGPPFLASRHKRNHNNNSRATRIHNHHSTSKNNDGYGQRRHGPLSFRRSEMLDHNSWHAQTRDVTVRSKRAAAKLLLLAENNGGGDVVGDSGIRGGVDDGMSGRNEQQARARRDTANCVVDVNARRQLLVGCTETNVIEVRPSCVEDGDEGESL